MPIVGKEFVDLLGGVAHNAPQHNFEVFLRIDAQIPADLHQRKDGGASLAVVLAVYEQPVFRPMVRRLRPRSATLLVRRASAFSR